MQRFHCPSSKSAACAALALAAGLGAPAWATDKNWTSQTDAFWSSPWAWSPAGQPGVNDAVNIGNVAGVQNSNVLLDLNEEVFNIEITDGMTLNTNGFTMDASLFISVSGRNTVGSNVYPSRLLVHQVVDGPEVFTSVVDVLDGGEVQLVGGGIRTDSQFDIGSQGILRGAGTVALDGAFTTFVNDGTVIAGPGTLTFTQVAGGRYDLDGDSGGGDLDLTTASNSLLRFQGEGLSEAFGGTLSMIRGTRLDMQFANPWPTEASGVFNIYGSGSGGAARITGAPLTFNGTINLYGGSDLSLESDITFGSGAELVTGVNAHAAFSGNDRVNAGLFTVNQGSTLDFSGPTELRGGTFITPSGDAANGAVDFLGATTWHGDVSFGGFARQSGPAVVNATSHIVADTFDMDGTGNADWDIDSSLTVTADRIDFSGNVFNNTMDIGGVGRLGVVLTNPADSWTMAGVLNLSGNALLFGNRIADGSPLIVTGTVNVSGRNDISTPSTIRSTATINLASSQAALRFMGPSVIGSGVTFTGVGMLHNGGNGDMTLNSGLNTGGAGLHNSGALRIGLGAGIVSVDRFETTGTWNVQIGGHAAGTEYDRLVSNGPVVLGGALAIELIDVDADGNAFHPSVGDEFTVLNAVGGITGAFDADVTSEVGSMTYHWEVIVGPADVVVRLASIDSGCRADFNLDGVVNSQDFFDFLVAFFAAGPGSDFNADGFTNSQDFFDFLTVFFKGC